MTAAAAPDVLFCAGAVKAGTSWLWDHLSRHPQVQFRSVKEVQFFDRLEGGRMPQRLKKLQREIAALEAELKAGPKWPAWVARQIADRKQLMQVFASDTPEAAYRAYLTDGAGEARLVGDMTPEYGLLSVQGMARASAILPRARWIFLMRDPVARLWSHVRMLARRTGCAAADFARVSAEKFEDALSGRAEDVVARSDYAGIHARLTAAVAPENRLVMLYERLFSAEGVARVTDFLGLAPRPEGLERRVHVGIALDMPEPLRARARDWLSPQYAFMAETYGLPAEWEAHPNLRSEVA